LKRALDEDPTVFQYDEVYDDMEQKKAETVAKKKDVSKKVSTLQTNSNAVACMVWFKFCSRNTSKTC
jgi:Coiled-coil domain-containing protein 55 (DUF2040)